MNQVTEENIQEVEIRATLEEVQYKKIKSMILAEGAKELGKEVLIDDYWCRKDAKSFEDIRMDAIGTYSLRTRTRKTTKGQASDINVKVITTENDHNAWDEHEVEVNSQQHAKNILKALGQKVFFSLEKTRESFGFDDKTVVLEDIVNFGYVLEVEILTTKDKSDEAKKQIREYILDTLSLNENQIVPKTVTNIMMQKYAKF